jgi:pyruvate kinase
MDGSKKWILCTLGPASMTPDVMTRLDELGVDLLRINLSHTDNSVLGDQIALVRAHTAIPICLDTQGAQIRTGRLAGSMTLSSGALLMLGPDTAEATGGDLPLYPLEVAARLRCGDFLSVDFDAALLQVVSLSPLTARVVSPGIVGSSKAVSLIGRAITLPPLTDTDLEAIAIGRGLGIRDFAVSFASQASDVELARTHAGPDARIIAKIESRKAIRNLAEILDATDAALIDRGDLSREVPLEKLPFLQKAIIRDANRHEVPVFVATNLLESMVSQRGPTRAEANDVVNTLLDGADGLVLAAETAIGGHPVGCVAMIRGLISEFEASPRGLELAESESISLLPAPHGGRLVESLPTTADGETIAAMPRLDVDEGTILDARQIATGAFSPLDGFMTKAEVESVLERYELTSGAPWPIPITLQLGDAVTPRFGVGDRIVIRQNGEDHAIVHVSEIYRRDLEALSREWYGSLDTAHPGVQRLFDGGDQFVAGRLELLPGQASTSPFQITPRQSRLIFGHRNWIRVVGFHTRNVAHRAHEYLITQALARHHCDGVFIHPVVGPKKPGDFRGDVVMDTYQTLIDASELASRAVLTGFDVLARYAGPREAVLTALCRKNYGCSHFIVGRDHTGVGDYYGPESARGLFEQMGDLGVHPIFFDEVYYCGDCAEHVESCVHGMEHAQRISGTRVRELLKQGEMPPDWCIRESVSTAILERLARGTEVFVD